MSNPELVWLSPEQIVPNPWNVNKMTAAQYAQEITSLRDHGWAKPLTVRPFKGAKGNYEIIDGENRWKAGKDLGHRKMPAWNVGPIDDDEAKKLGLLLNDLHGQASPDLLGSLLKELLQDNTVEELVAELPYPEEMIRGLADLPMPELPPLEAPPGGEREARWVERLFKLPPAAAKVLDDALEKAKAGDQIEAWQALERLAAEYLAGP